MNLARAWDTDPELRRMCAAVGVSSPGELARVVAGEKVSKMSPDASDVHVNSALGRRRRLRRVRKSAAALGVGAAAGYGTITTLQPEDKFKRLQRVHRTVAPGLAEKQTQWKEQRRVTSAEKKLKRQERETYAKSVDWEGTFSKVDTDKRQVFGWASIVKMDGKPVVDRQGDWIDEDEMEKSAYEYVVKSRKGGDQHKRTDDGQPFHASDMIESFVVTDEKKQRLGLPDDLPTGWWVGFKVHDDETWRKVKAGDVTGFSIHGRGKREPVEGVFDPVETATS